jgi:ABC-type Zn uptake system ZnuABC Zn-binding protein ZnuA
MRKIIIIIAVLVIAVGVLIVLLAWPSQPAGAGNKNNKAKITYVASIHPIASIVEEIVAGRADVATLLPPNVSPHTYDYTPADLMKVQNALAMIYVGENLDQVWAEKLPAKNKVKLLDFVPNEYRLANTDIGEGEAAPANVPQGSQLPNEATDAHFWTDPLTVKAIVPGLVNKLCELDKDGEQTYRANGEKFMAHLDDINKQIGDILAPVKGKPVFLLHPSFRYLCHRYGLVMAQTVEPSPGKEPTQEEIKQILEQMNKTGAKAVFSEPQLPKNYVEVLARDAHIAIYELDPEGTGKEGLTYSDFMRYNADTLLKALK